MYTIKKVATLAGVTLKTLRHYDRIGLLVPSARGENGYRLYSNQDLNCLQQILFYRELDFSLIQIKKILDAKDFEVSKSLEHQIELLKAKSKRIENIIVLAQTTLKNIKGDIEMTENKKFEAFKDRLIEDNDKQYGEEVIRKYGADTYNASKKKLKAMTKEQCAELEQLSIDVNNAFVVAQRTGNPKSVEAIVAVELHKKWLMYHWTEFNKDAYVSLANIYAGDPRFAAYYDKLGDGMATFVRDSIIEYCKHN